jgi:hypothetical protein
MPERQREAGVALALSGGGFCATLFHLGTLGRLNELKLLRDLREIYQRLGRLDRFRLAGAAVEQARLRRHGRGDELCRFGCQAPPPV